MPGPKGHQVRRWRGRHQATGKAVTFSVWAGTATGGTVNTLSASAKAPIDQDPFFGKLRQGTCQCGFYFRPGRLTPLSKAQRWQRGKVLKHLLGAKTKVLPIVPGHQEINQSSNRVLFSSLRDRGGRQAGDSSASHFRLKKNGMPARSGGVGNEVPRALARATPKSTSRMLASRPTRMLLG